MPTGFDGTTLQIAIVLVLVVVVFFGFIRETLPPDVVALSAVAFLLITRILSTDDVLSVFSNSAPITVGAMFVLSAALERTGAIDSMGRAVVKAARVSPLQAFAGMMVAVMVMSAFINNTPVVVVLTPVVILLGKSIGMAPTKLLIPLSFASIFGGTTTLIGTSTNIIVDGVAQGLGLKPIGMFEITAAGLIMGAVGIVYLLLVGRHLLPEGDTSSGDLPDAADRFFLAEVLVPYGSPLIGQSLKDAKFTEERGRKVVDVIRRGVSLRVPLADLKIMAGDRLVLHTKVGDMLGLREEGGGLELAGAEAYGLEPMGAQELIIAEGVIGPQSRSIGRRVGDLNFRRLYDVFILAIHRHGERLTGNFDQVRLRVGDTVLLEGPPAALRRLFDQQEIINISQPSEKPFRRQKAPIAISAIIAVVVLSAFEVLPIAALAIMAATVVVALGCLTSDDAYRSIRWNILMLIFGMLALGIAMEKTGAARLIVTQAAALAEGFGPLIMLSMVYLLTSTLTEFMSNNAAAILITPLAVGLAVELGVDPRPFAIAVLFAASASFATPIGYQTNTFVYNAGGYRFVDFVRIGLPLNILMWITATLVIPMFWPLD